MVSKLTIVAVLAVWAFAGTAAPAQAQFDWGTVFADAQCNGSQADISVTLDVFGEVPSDLVGWVVDREVLGACVPPVQVGEVMPFPEGQQQYFVVDQPTLADRVTLYYVYAVDADGNRMYIPWTQRTNFVQTDCLGGPVARGTVVELYEGYYYLDVCDGACWWGLSTLDGTYPPEMPGLVGQVIDLYGEIYNGMEGPYVVADGWSVPSEGCGQIIPVGDDTWSALKASFR